LHGFSGPLGQKWGGTWGQNKGRSGAILTPNELILTFRGSYVCANLGENRLRNTTVRVLADGQTDRQTQTDFIICPMLYAIAMGQIINTLCPATWRLPAPAPPSCLTMCALLIFFFLLLFRTTPHGSTKYVQAYNTENRL